jgi:hypothetical protein
MRIGCAACLIGLLLTVLACAMAPGWLLPDSGMLHWAAHVQRGVAPAIAGEAALRGGLMTAAAVIFILVIELGLTWKSTALFAGAPRSRLLIASSTAITIAAVVSIGVLYAFGIGPFAVGLATEIGPDLVYDRLGYPAVIGLELLGYYGILTNLRFGRSAGKPRC